MSHDPVKVLNTVAEHGLIDFGQPVAVLTAVLQHLSDSDAVELPRTIRDYVTRDSHLVLSHPSTPEPGNADLADAIEHYQTTTATWTLRDISQAPALLGTGWTPRPPGITAIGLWHPDIAAPGALDEDPRFVEAQAGIPGWAVIAAAAPTPPRHGGDR
ncbi:MAG TPA: SAM-dependent methyltransferase [Catenuloplanes sp.]